MKDNYHNQHIEFEIFGQSPLHTACENDQLEIVQYFNQIANNSNNNNSKDILNKKNRKGETPFFVALVNNSLSIVRYMIQNQDTFKIDIPNKDGLSPIDFARQKGDKRLLSLFTSNQQGIFICFYVRSYRTTK